MYLLSTPTIYKTYIYITSCRLNTRNIIQNIHIYHLVPIKHPNNIQNIHIYHPVMIKHPNNMQNIHIYITSYRLNTPKNIQNLHLYHLVPFKHPQQYTKHTSISPRNDKTPQQYAKHISISPFTDSTHPTIHKTYIYITSYRLNTPNNIQNIHLYHPVTIKHPNNMQNIYLYHLLPIQHPQQYTKHTSISPFTDSTPPTVYKTYIYITLYLLNTQTIYKTFIYITP